jgi:hypothetical protein
MRALLLPIILVVGFAGCVARPQLDLGGVAMRLHSPAIFEQTMARFDVDGPAGFPPPDGALVGHWINRAGYLQAEQPMIRIYGADGTWTAHDGSGDFVTFEADGLRWLYEVSRYPDRSVSGRSLRVYAVDGDQMLARFPRRHTGWEFWERWTDKRLRTVERTGCPSVQRRLRAMRSRKWRLQPVAHRMR